MIFFGKIFDRIAKKKEVIKLFREKGALSVELAKNSDELGEFNRAAFNKLHRKGVVESAGGDTYFLNEQELMKDGMNRVKWAMIFLFALLVVIVLSS